MGSILERAWKVVEWLLLIAAVVAATALSLTLHWLVYRELATTDRVRVILGRPVTDADLYGYAALVVGAVKIALLTAALNAWARSRRVMAAFLIGLFSLAFVESVVAVGGFFVSAQSERGAPVEVYLDQLDEWRSQEQSLAQELAAAREARSAIQPTPISADTPAARVEAIQARDQAAIDAADKRVARAEDAAAIHQQARPSPPTADPAQQRVDHPLYDMVGAWTGLGSSTAKLAFLALVALIIELTAAGGVYAIGASAPVWGPAPARKARRASWHATRAVAAYARGVWALTAPKPAPIEVYRALADWAWRAAPIEVYRALCNWAPVPAPEALYRLLYGWRSVPAPLAVYQALYGWRAQPALLPVYRALCDWAIPPLIVTAAEDARALEPAPNVVPLNERLAQIRERYAAIEAERALSAPAAPGNVDAPAEPDAIETDAPAHIEDTLHEPVRLQLDDEGPFGEVTIR